jgi:hypothetical protein
VQADRRPFWLTWTGLLLAAAILSGAVAWWMIAWPIASLSNSASHQGHFPMTFAHMVGGTGMLGLGALNLFLGAVRTRAKLHRRVGQAYLLIGAFGAISAMAITLSPAHKPTGAPVFTNATVSLTMLAVAWLSFSALAWRAARNRQFVSHRDWAIRSYVLVWSFVFCRIVSRASDLDQLGGGEAFIWLSWVGPILICEIALQWSRGAPLRRREVV